MFTESTFNNVSKTEEMKEKALLVFDLISRTLYTSVFTQKDEKDG